LRTYVLLSLLAKHKIVIFCNKVMQVLICHHALKKKESCGSSSCKTGAEMRPRNCSLVLKPEAKHLFLNYTLYSRYDCETKMQSGEYAIL
jgi:hypothetical protein